MRDLVNLYFKGHNIVNHHVSSFNDFLATDDNPNSRMQRIVDDVSVQPDGIDHGIIRIDVDKDSPYDDILHQAYVMIILARILPYLQLKEKSTGTGENLVYRTVSYIAEHYTEEDLTLTKVAHDLFVSPFALSRIFSGTFHMNFNKYLNITRLEYVRYLLEYTDQSITEAYENAGFGSQRTFNRAFREHFHMTPKEYRELNQKEWGSRI